MNVDDLEGNDEVACLIMSRALGILLRENEGMVIELPEQEHDPDFPKGKFVIWRGDEHIRLCPVTDEEDEALQKAEHGQMFWNHAHQH